MNHIRSIYPGHRFPFERCSYALPSIQSSATDPVIFSSIQPSTQPSTQNSIQSSIQRGILDGARRPAQLGDMKSMMLFLLGVRLLFLSAAGAMCIYGLLHAADPKVLWYWTVGHVLVLAACVFLIGKVWASLKATWKE